MRHCKKGITGIGIMVSCGVMVLCGVGFWGLTHIIASNVDVESGGVSDVFEYLNDCDNIVDEQIAEIRNLAPLTQFRSASKDPSDDQYLGYDTVWSGDLSRSLEENLFGIDFNFNGSFADTIPARKEGGGGVFIVRHTSGGGLARVSRPAIVGANDMVILFTEDVPVYPDLASTYYIGTNQETACWGWNHG